MPESNNHYSDMEDGENNDVHEPKRRAIGGKLREIFDANGGPVNPDLLKTFEDDFFRQACEYLGKEMLSLDFLKSRLNEFWLMRTQLDKGNSTPLSMLKRHLKDGTECFLLVSPTTDTGHDYSSKLVSRNACFYNCSVYDDPENNGQEATEHFSYRVGPFASVFPDKMRKQCSFQVEWDKDDSGNVAQHMTASEFVRFNNAYLECFNNLRKYFGMEPLDTTGLVMNEEDYIKKAGFTGKVESDLLKSVPTSPSPPSQLPQ
jgi:hypothetical protein